MRPSSIGLLALAVLAVACLRPLVVEQPPVALLAPWSSWVMAAVLKAAVLLVLGGVVAWRVQRDEQEVPGLRAGVALVFAAALMTLWHVKLVESHGYRLDWQIDLYGRLLNHAYDAPHQYRPLPYGFVRTLEHVTRDWFFSCLVYRWFFSFWFLWAWVRFVALFQPAGRAYATLLVLLPLYPLSVSHYWGQLTDPLSHFLFVLALVYAVEDRPWRLAAAVALGVMAKESAVVAVPAYFALWWWRFPGGWLRTAGVGAAAVLAFLAVRVPLGWRPGYEKLNGTTGLMVGTNLGIGPPLYIGAAPPWENYFHPALFVGAFVPFVAYQWNGLDRRLRTLVVVVPALVLLSNLCFGWMYESRNYVPLLPLLAAAVLPGRDSGMITREPRAPGPRTLP